METDPEQAQLIRCELRARDRALRELAEAQANLRRLRAGSEEQEDRFLVIDKGLSNLIHAPNTAASPVRFSARVRRILDFRHP